MTRKGTTRALDENFYSTFLGNHQYDDRPRCLGSANREPILSAKWLALKIIIRRIQFVQNVNRLTALPHSLSIPL